MRRVRAIRPGARALALALALAPAACGRGSLGHVEAPPPDPCLGVTCPDHASCATASGQSACACDPGYLGPATACVASALPALGGCQILPADHLFNTPIADLPVHPSSAAFLTSIGAANLHLDLGTTIDPTSSSYWGIPWNLVHGDSLTWHAVHYRTSQPNYTWDPLRESDCAVSGPGSTHPLVSPCLASAAPTPLLPIPAAPLVEGGLVGGARPPDGDHHLLVIDVDACRLWELYHCFPDGQGGLDIFGSASWDLGSDALRPANWTAADAAGFPILPLLLRAAEASAGAIQHALRFTIPPDALRASYTWPARHQTGSLTSTALPQMGQLFRLKASYAIPPAFNTQARAILTALKTYGMYVADGGSRWYVTGEPSADWLSDTFSQIQSVGSDQFEAVDLGPVTSRPGWSADSARVPPP